MVNHHSRFPASARIGLLGLLLLALSRCDEGHGNGSMPPMSADLPMTTVVGKTVSESGQIMVGVRVNVADIEGRSQDDGHFELKDVQATCALQVLAAQGRMSGRSNLVPPVVEGTTDVGDIVLRSHRNPLFPGPRFPTGKEVSVLALADFNLDGAIDVAALHEDANQVSVLLGHRDSTFALPQVIPVDSESPRSLAVADFDEDQVPDLITANVGTDDVTLLRGLGDGGFVGYWRTGVGQDPQAITAADIDNDGHADIVTANASSNDVTVLLGTGKGAFRSRLDLPVGEGPRSVQIADVDADGNPDVVTANAFSNDISVLFGGAFVAQRRFKVAEGPESVAVADLNCDLLPDLATIGASTVSVLLGRGGRQFDPVPPEATPVLGGRSLSMSDQNADGYPDLIVSENRTFICLGNGDGTFRRDCPGLYGSSSAATGDLNNDKALDLVVASSDAVATFVGRGDGTFETGRDLGGFPLVIIDLNNDEEFDIVAADFFHEKLVVLLGKGDGNFSEPLDVGVEPTSRVEAARINDDGIVDLYTGQVSLIGRGDGTFNAVSSPSQTWRLGHLDRDGLVDLVNTRYGSPLVTIHIGNGDGTFHKHQEIETRFNSPNVELADLNRDGVTDIVVSDGCVYVGDGNGSFPPELARCFSTSSSADFILLADVDADGDVDIVTTKRSSGYLRVWVALGDATFEEQPTLLRVGEEPRSATGADVDRDGRPDLVTVNWESRDISILYGLGSAVFESDVRVAVGSRPHALWVGDLNSDASIDLVLLRVVFLPGLSYEIVVLFGRGGRRFEPRYFAGSPGLRVADLNSDGKFDLVGSVLLFQH